MFSEDREAILYDNFFEEVRSTRMSLFFKFDAKLLSQA